MTVFDTSSTNEAPQCHCPTPPQRRAGVTVPSPQFLPASSPGILAPNFLPLLPREELLTLRNVRINSQRSKRVSYLSSPGREGRSKLQKLNCLIRTAHYQHPVERSERRNGDPEQRSPALSTLLESKATFQLMGPGPEGSGSYSKMCLSTVMHPGLFPSTCCVPGANPAQCWLKHGVLS